MEFVSGNVFIRKNHMPSKGLIVNGHTHNFDHTTIVFSGGIHVKAKLPDGRVIDRDFYAPNHCLIRAEVEHEITSLVDDTEFWCVYSHRTPQGDVVQEYTGFDKGYQ